MWKKAINSVITSPRAGGSAHLQLLQLPQPTPTNQKITEKILEILKNVRTSDQNKQARMHWICTISRLVDFTTIWNKWGSSTNSGWLLFKIHLSEWVMPGWMDLRFLMGAWLPPNLGPKSRKIWKQKLTNKFGQKQQGISLHTQDPPILMSNGFALSHGGMASP